MHLSSIMEPHTLAVTCTQAGGCIPDDMLMLYVHTQTGTGGYMQCKQIPQPCCLPTHPTAASKMTLEGMPAFSSSSCLTHLRQEDLYICMYVGGYCNDISLLSVCVYYIPELSILYVCTVFTLRAHVRTQLCVCV